MPRLYLADKLVVRPASTVFEGKPVGPLCAGNGNLIRVVRGVDTVNRHVGPLRESVSSVRTAVIHILNPVVVDNKTFT